MTLRNLGIRGTWMEMDREQDRKGSEIDPSFGKDQSVGCEFEGRRSPDLSPQHSLIVN